jgi:hypothetical protein
MRRVFQRLIAISIVAAAASCAVGVEDESSIESASEDGAEPVASSSQALTSCSHSCECDLGSYCDTGWGEGFCNSVIFSPPPPSPYCYGDCQCPYSYKCYNPNNWGGGQCVYVKSTTQPK